MRFATGLLAFLMCSAALAEGPGQRALSFEDRVKAQTAIERVYYSHQLLATKPFEGAVPKAAIENKVRRYLDQSAALALYWKTAVTDESLERELARMAKATRMPGRLSELFSALGNDPFIIKECLARATLVDRLTRNFYAFDSTLHAGARQRAAELHRQLSSGALDPFDEHANRTELGLVMGEKETAEEFRKQRAGQVSDVRESRDEFAFSVILSETTTTLRVASYVIPKTTWDTWWEGARHAAGLEPVGAVASDRGPLAKPASVLPCRADDTWDSGSLGALPVARSGHTAVWTGSVMLIWGGYGNTVDFNTGARYDPALDSWTAMSTTGAPPARSGHTAVWTGRAMVVWGGHSATEFSLDTGGRYDPSTDSWAPTSMKDAPASRFSHTAVWTGDLMIVWGGTGAAYPYDLDTGGRYDPVTDDWTPTSTIDAPSGRESHVAVWTGEEMVVWGGDGSSQSGGRYDPATDRWKATAKTGIPEELRHGYTAVWTGRVMVVWGDPDWNVGARYDPVTDTWTPTSTTDAPSPRRNHAAIWTGTRMMIWGGEGSRGRGISTGGSYDPITDQWTRTSVSAAPSARYGHTAVWTGSDMLVWGGYGQYSTGGDPGTFFNTGGRYDPTTETWTPTSTVGVTPAQRGHTVVWTGNVMVVWGGRLPDRLPHHLNTGSRYDPATDSWTPTATTGAPDARQEHSAVWTGSRMIVWGGETDAGDSLATGGGYDPATDVWTATSTTDAPSARIGHTAVWTGTQMVVWGGFSYPNDLDTGGRYNPATDTWTPTSTTDAPVGRDAHSAVWTGSLMLVWGGYSDFSDINSGGRYNPTTDSWTPVSTTNAPAPPGESTAVWTGSLMVVWGGSTDRGGRYDPATDTWTETSLTDAPSERSHHTAVWTGNVMVVWGGNVGFSGDTLDSGGRYDPALDSWTATSTTGAPSPRAGHTAVWTGNVMLVWGGDSLINVGSLGRYFLRGSGATETCNGIDDDCDGVVDNGGDALCNDGNACTTDTCNSETGACSNPARPNGTVCDDASRCTTGETCQSGACTPSFSRLNRPQPRGSSYYRQLCERRRLRGLPFLADQLTSTDAACVSQETSTFAGVATIDDICRVLDGDRRSPRGRSLHTSPGYTLNGNDCGQASSELITAALNICRSQVCEEQSIDSRCHGNTRTTIGQLFTDADAILADAARTKATCAVATCELLEINNGDRRRPGAPPSAAKPVAARVGRKASRR